MKNLFLLTLIFASFISKAQGPNITNWLQNTTETGSYYTQGNNTAIPNNILVNCQVVNTVIPGCIYLQMEFLPTQLDPF